MLEITNLGISRGGHTLAGACSFKLASREIVFISGRNGVGKTTFMSILAGFLPAEAGRIEFRGEDITGWGAHKRLSQVFAAQLQGGQVFPDLTVGQHFELIGCSNLFETKEMFVQVVGKNDEFSSMIASKWRQTANTLSGGEKSELSLFITLLRGGHILLLDEPSAGLSFSKAEYISQIVNSYIHQGDSAAVIVDHILDPWENYALKKIVLTNDT